MTDDSLSARLSWFARCLGGCVRALLAGVDPDSRCLAEAVEQVRSDSHKVEVLRNLASQVDDGQLSGRGVLRILQSFSSDRYKVEALGILSPKLEEPGSLESKAAIVACISEPRYQAEASAILVRQ